MDIMGITTMDTITTDIMAIMDITDIIIIMLQDIMEKEDPIATKQELLVVLVHQEDQM